MFLIICFVVAALLSSRRRAPSLGPGSAARGRSRGGAEAAGRAADGAPDLRAEPPHCEPTLGIDVAKCLYE